MIGHDFEPREIRSFDVEGDLAPEVGQRLTRYQQPDMPQGEFVTTYGTGPWEVVEILEVSQHPGWVRVYVVLVEGDSAPWEDEDLTPC
jgi:hypothetical protein